MTDKEQAQHPASSDSLVWETEEYKYREKSPDWYWSLGLLVAAGAIAAYFLENFLFIVLLLVGGFTVALYAARKPRVMRCEASPRGLRINNTLYPFASLESFWVTDELPAKLLVKSKKILLPLIVVPAGENPEKLRAFLLIYLPEEEVYEPFFEKLMEWLGF